MDFTKFFALIKPRITWFDADACWLCQGCNVKLDKPSKELHWTINCSLSKLKALQKIRQSVITSNLKLYQKYCESKGVIIDTRPKVEDEDKPVPLEWYHKRIEDFSKLPMNMGEPSGAEVIEPAPIPLRKLTAEDLIPKICKKKIIKTGDPIIDFLPMRDMPFRDLDGHILSYEELDELEKQEKEGKKK